MTPFKAKDSTNNWVVGVGSALVDILTYEDDAFLARTGALKGGMTLVDKVFIDDTLAATSSTPTFVPGGSACNTIVGVGRLGGKARFIGKCGNGRLGKLFRQDLEKHNVEPRLIDSDAPTGRCLSIITPDSQRSMFTYLGASAQTLPKEIETDHFEGAAVAHVEGYLLHNPELLEAALALAKRAGAMVSLDLASYNVVVDALPAITRLVEKYVDLLIANEDEAEAFTGQKDEMKALDAMGEKASLAALKVGARGSFIAHDGAVTKVAPRKGAVPIDTTGAGDLWAAGFLYGLVNGLSLERCGDLASVCGYEVCQVIGANIPDDGWDRIKKSTEG
ncbi:MAG: adenosine kinase [Desulfosarcinaceae bacterium]|jgi:sugar/nucleoside kinase (ribokinase family)